MRPKACRLARHGELRWRVAQKLALQWSPEQISGWLKRQFPADQGMWVSYETIYRSLFIQTRGVLKKELMAHLRTARQMRQAKGGTTKRDWGRSSIPSPSASGRPRSRTAPCQATGRETFSPERTTRHAATVFLDGNRSLAHFSQSYLNRIAQRLNQRPRGQERDTYRDFGLRVLWVEAIDEVFDELVKNIAGHPNQKAFCALLTDQDDAEYQFHIASNEGESSSIYQFGECLDIWPELSYLSNRTLRSRRLDSLFRLEGIQPSDYPALVMDVQGAELLVLKGAGQMLGEFRFIKAEAADFESYVDCAKLDDLHRFLEPLGFKEKSRNQFASHPNGGNYWDVVWERPARGMLERAKWGLAEIAKKVTRCKHQFDLIFLP